MHFTPQARLIRNINLFKSHSKAGRGAHCSLSAEIPHSKCFRMNLKDILVYTEETIKWPTILTCVSLHFLLRVMLIFDFQREIQHQRSQWRADIKRISKMNSSFKSLHVRLMLTWWGFSYDFDAERIKERSQTLDPVTCSHMKHADRSHLDMSTV